MQKEECNFNQIVNTEIYEILLKDFIKDYYPLPEHSFVSSINVFQLLKKLKVYFCYLPCTCQNKNTSSATCLECKLLEEINIVLKQLEK